MESLATITASHHRRLTAVFVALLFTLSGCALLGGGEKELVRAKGFSTDSPDDWQETDAAGESDRAFRLKSKNLVTLTSSCGHATTQSLEQLTRSLLIGTRHKKILRQEAIVVQSESALHSTVQTTLEGKSFWLDIVVLRKNGCVFDFTLMSPRPLPAEDRKEFLQFVRSFQYGKG